MEKRRIVIAMTGASGASYGVKLIEMLNCFKECEIHFIASKNAVINLQQELGLTIENLRNKVDHVYDPNDLTASISSGSFITEAMIVIPCSMKTLSSIAFAYADNLITRAADVTLKERRKLILVTREAPLNLAHIRAMQFVTEMGGIIYPRPLHNKIV
jgi:polyprenyl P-hydroxybenzoate/phenylacrylic acid decarboxylase-like protein